MRSPFSRHSTLFPLIIFLIYFLGSFLSTWTATAQEELAKGIEESYEGRPDILLVPAKPMSGNDHVWKRSLRGHVETLAMILEMFHDFDLYFLARDGEHFYDLARLVKRTDPHLDFARIHLINVSRGNLDDTNLSQYLFQEGISGKDLENGKKILLVDTGLQGSIPARIKKLIPSKAHHQIKVQLLSSVNPHIPSTRVFLASLQPHWSPEGPTIENHHIVLHYEKISRYTARSYRFAKIENRWHPISFIPPGSEDRIPHTTSLQELKEMTKTSDDRPSSRELAMAYMGDLRSYFEEPETMVLMAKKRHRWRQFRDLLDTRNREGILNLAKELLEEAKDDPEELRFNKAMIFDFLETARLNFGLSDGDLPLPSEFFALETCRKT